MKSTPPPVQFLMDRSEILHNASIGKDDVYVTM